MTAPPQRPPVAFKPGDRVRSAGSWLGTVTGVEGQWVTVGYDVAGLYNVHAHYLEPAPPPAAADDGLRERMLREADIASGSSGYWRPMVIEAADLIATLRAENEAKTAEIARLQGEVDCARNTQNTLNEVRAEVARLTAELIKTEGSLLSSALKHQERATRAEAALAAKDVELAGMRAKIAEQGECPFEDPKFNISQSTPCPVCGDLGTWDHAGEPSKCVSRGNRIS